MKSDFDNKDDFYPNMAFVVYMPKGDENTCYFEHAYITYNEIEEDYMVGAFQPTPVDVLSKLIDSVKYVYDTRSFLQVDGNIMPKNVLLNTTSGSFPWVVWYRPKQVTRFYYKGNHGEIDAEILMPNLVFELKNESVRIFATFTQNITTDTVLYRAPLPNLYEKNTVCWGSVNINGFLTGSLQNHIKGVEKAFFDSYFNDHGVMKNDEKYFEYIKKMTKDHKLEFPKEYYEKVGKYGKVIIAK